MSEFTARLNIENFKAQLLTSYRRDSKNHPSQVVEGGKAAPQRHDDGQAEVELCALRSLV
jgi:hypothetical protein